MKKCIDFNEKVYRNGKVLYDFEAFETQSGLTIYQLPADIPKASKFSGLVTEGPVSRSLALGL